MYDVAAVRIEEYSIHEGYDDLLLGNFIVGTVGILIRRIFFVVIVITSSAANQHSMHSLEQ